MVQIVNINVSQQVASAPSVLQQTGAFVTQGGTTTANNAATLLTSLADLADIINSNSAADELTAMATTFFAQGNNVSVYVLELGEGSSSSDLGTYISDLAGTTGYPKFYSYLVPASWDTDSSFRTLTSTYAGNTAQTYFYVSSTISTYSAWTSLGNKSVFLVLPSPSAPSTEFSAAAFFHVSLAYDPNASNLVSPMAWSYLYGVTAYGSLNNSAQVTLLAAGCNWVGTGAEGGISNRLIVGGQFMDLNPFNYWYCVDWLSINVELSLAAAVINGSNNPTAPLYYNQNGINRLQGTAQAVVNNGISFGLILAPATVAAVPFTTYVEQNPSDYAIGQYNGLSLTFVPARGFQSITVYLTASNIPV